MLIHVKKKLQIVITAYQTIPRPSPHGAKNRIFLWLQVQNSLENGIDVAER